mgnify:CR=1 FL=1
MADGISRKKITSSSEAFEILQPLMGDLQHEEFWVIYVNNSNKILKTNCISKGGIAGTLADVRLIFKVAVENNASALVLAHNHPSGNIEPSLSDIKLTKKLACYLLQSELNKMLVC